MKDHPDSGFRPLNDLDKVALAAGIPADQFRFVQEPIAGWWLEIRKPADHTAWYRRWNSSLEPWHRLVEQWIRDAGVAGRLVSEDLAHHTWVEI
jgi:hypothetical protein